MMQCMRGTEDLWAPQTGSDTNLTADRYVLVNVGCRTKAQRFVRHVNFSYEVQLRDEMRLKGRVNQIPTCVAGGAKAPRCVAWGWCRWPSDPRQGCKQDARGVGRMKSDDTQRATVEGVVPTENTQNDVSRSLSAHLSGPRAVETTGESIAENNVTNEQGERRTFGGP